MPYITMKLILRHPPKLPLFLNCTKPITIMKKAILSLLLTCCVAIAAQAQYATFAINNNTGVTVYVTLYGEATATCGSNYSSNIIAVPAFTSLFYSDPTQVSGGMFDGFGNQLSSSGYFTGAIAMDGPSTCATTLYYMSNCPGGSTFVHQAPLMDVTCTTTMHANINYITNTSPSHASIDFN